MHHRFFLEHPEFVLPHASIRPDRQTLDIMRGCATQKLVSVHLPLEGTRASVETSSLILRLWLRERMAPYQHIAEVNQRLIRAVYLQRLIQRFRGRRMNTKTRRHLCARVGYHLQRELTLLLLETPMDFHGQIIACKDIVGVSTENWATSLLGASGEAYALRALATRTGARVFLPEAAEDLFDSTDLFWLENNRLHAVSVKSRWEHEERIRALRVNGGPLNGFSGWSKHHLRSIREGSIRHSRRVGVPCAPVALRLTTPRDSLVHLRRLWNQVAWPNRILDQTSIRIQSA